MTSVRDAALARFGGFIALVGLGWTQPAAAQLPGWTFDVHDLGGLTPTSLAADRAGNVYVGGWGSDGSRLYLVVAKHGVDLGEVWTRSQPADDEPVSVDTDGQGDVFVAGQIGVFAKLNADGSPLWVRRSKTARQDLPSGVATDGLGSLFSAGWTAWLAKWDGSGTLLWRKQLGRSHDDAVAGIASDPTGNVIVAGSTWTSLLGPNRGEGDAFVAKFDGNGALLWGNQFGGKGVDTAARVVSDADGNVYVSGTADNDVSGPGGGHVFVAKLDGVTGTLQWGVRFGSDTESVSGAAVAPDGTLYLTGSTNGSLFRANLGYSDAWVAHFAPDGTILQRGQFGTPGPDFARALAVDADGTVIIAGSLAGSGFLAKLAPAAAP